MRLERWNLSCRGDSQGTGGDSTAGVSWGKLWVCWRSHMIWRIVATQGFWSSDDSITSFPWWTWKWRIWCCPVGFYYASAWYSLLWSPFFLFIMGMFSLFCYIMEGVAYCLILRGFRVKRLPWVSQGSSGLLNNFGTIKALRRYVLLCHIVRSWDFRDGHRISWLESDKLTRPGLVVVNLHC